MYLFNTILLIETKTDRYFGNSKFFEQVSQLPVNHVLQPASTCALQLQLPTCFKEYASFREHLEHYTRQSIFLNGSYLCISSDRISVYNLVLCLCMHVWQGRVRSLDDTVQHLKLLGECRTLWGEHEQAMHYGYVMYPRLY